MGATLAAVQVSVGKALNNRPELVQLWFANMLQYSMADTLTGHYSTFAEIGVATLQMVAEQQNIALTEANAEAAIVGPIRSLPAHPDVVPGLDQLQKFDLTLVTPTNSSKVGVRAQMVSAGSASHFQRYLSIDAIQKYEPDAIVGGVNDLADRLAKPAA